ncbi:MAG TPA: UDP-3-O-(3-hydroxymyristoyl)glucosamine N-acyltransferase [Planctomycetes bacterium]|nr:UDP-3-O-(3-hydroxymyristoyl)glucosamine N-acyltransferase [Planctomycetota bacterium]
MFELNQPIRANLLLEELGMDPCLEGDPLLTSVAAIERGEGGSLCFATREATTHDAAVVVTTPALAPSFQLAVPSENPRLAYIQLLAELERRVGFRRSQEEPRVHPTARIGENVVLKKGVTIGAHTVIEPNVVIEENVTIGESCLIRANTSIGSDGFGYSRDPSGRPVKFIHLGSVVIGDHVEIGACTCVARGTLGNTVIEDHVKIDNLVHIAHNCTIKRGAFVIACAEVSGGVTVGENAWIAPNATLRDAISIGGGSTIGLGAVVTKSVEANSVVLGNPARPKQ